MADKEIQSEEVRRLLEALSRMVAQWCTQKDGTLDSCALTAAANGMRIMSEYGMVKIEHEVGRRVIGHWTNEKPHEQENITLRGDLLKATLKELASSFGSDDPRLRNYLLAIINQIAPE